MTSDRADAVAQVLNGVGALLFVSQEALMLNFEKRRVKKGGDESGNASISFSLITC